MARKTKDTTKQQAVAEADTVLEMTGVEIAALPGLLGRIASVRAAHDGFYAYISQPTGTKVCIVLRA